MLIRFIQHLFPVSRNREYSFVLSGIPGWGKEIASIGLLRVHYQIIFGIQLCVMKSQEQLNYERIAAAIGYLQLNFKSQPELEEIAERINLSPFHFQKLFTDWAGVSPKKFLQYITIYHAKKLLKEQRVSVFDTAIATGLSGTGRLHDLFIRIEGMTPAEYKQGGKNLQLNYSFADTPFGEILVASTTKGICHIAFADDQKDALNTLKLQFPNAEYRQVVDQAQQNALFIFTHDWSKLNEIKLHLRGTAFQLKVWETILQIPMGQVTTYGTVAKKMMLPGASRAVGSAIADNPVAFLIPCHRIIQSTGLPGGYHWGSVRKAAILGWEAARSEI